MKTFRTIALVTIVVVVVVVAYPLWLGFRVWDQSHEDEVVGADAIVVLGAAQYDGVPSPVFQARLDHALYLYNEDLSDIIIVTGGKQAGDRFTEAQAGETYVTSEGVPGDAVLAESEGRTTFESLRAVRAIAAQQGVSSVLLVSDPLHSERIKRIASDLGFEGVYASPASYTQLERSRSTKARELVREVASLLAYQFLNR
ncbi:MAG: YdcF family protein [Actinomycetota bacterium]|nr:YdcF family protein [Actinomycetota bacterium]